MVEYVDSLHSVSCLSWVFGRTCVPRSVRNAANSVPKSTRHATVASLLSVHDSVSASVTTTEYWKQLRRESLGRSYEGSKSPRLTSIMTKPAESKMKQSSFGELAEQVRNFHGSADALADCLHAGDISQTDPNLIEAAKHLYHKLLRKTNDEMECMPSQTCDGRLIMYMMNAVVGADK